MTDTCLEGYQTSGGGNSFPAKCNDHDGESGEWELGDDCSGINFLYFLFKSLKFLTLNK